MAKIRVTETIEYDVEIPDQDLLDGVLSRSAEKAHHADYLPATSPTLNE